MSNAHDEQREGAVVTEPRVDALAKILSRGGSRRYLLGGVLAGAVGLGLGPAAEETEAARSVEQCRQVKRGRKRRRCLRRAARRAKRRNTRPGQGLLRNFAITINNNTSQQMFFVVGIPNVDRGRQEYVGRRGSRRFFVEDDWAEIFIWNGNKNPNGDHFGGGLVFYNPLIGEVSAEVYPSVTYSLLHNDLNFGSPRPGSEKVLKIGDTRTIDLEFVTFELKRNENDKNKGDYYIEVEMTFN